ncbi:hypothetical protein BU15DRAFT_66849, partial [Melanogaster broomeanus]
FPRMSTTSGPSLASRVRITVHTARRRETPLKRRPRPGSVSTLSRPLEKAGTRHLGRTRLLAIVQTRFRAPRSMVRHPRSRVASVGDSARFRQGGQAPTYAHAQDHGSSGTLTVESIGDGRERSREEDPGTSEVIKESERGRDVKRVGWGVKAGKEEDHDDPVRDSDSEHTDMHGKEERETWISLFAFWDEEFTSRARTAGGVKHFSRPDVQLWYIQCPPDLLISRSSVDFLKCTPVSTIGHALSPIIEEGLITAVDALAFVPLPGLEVAARALLGVWEACRPVVAKF